MKKARFRNRVFCLGNDSYFILLILFVGVMYLFVFKLCVYDYVIFKADGIELRTPFKKKAFFKYNEVIACFAEYTSIVEQKKYLTFTNKKYNSIVTHKIKSNLFL